VEASVNSLRNEMNGVHNEMNSLRGEMNSLRGEMNSLRGEMNSLRGEMSSLHEEMNAKLETIHQRIDNIEKRIDDMQTFFYWGFGMLFSLMIFTLGFIIWDRRTTLAPVKLDIEELKSQNEKMKEIFRKHSESHPQLREILRNAGIF
jgi:uncharacterized coiled-coil DUF342 family protein